MGKQRCYLAAANTSTGFASFFDYVIKDAERVYILKGSPGSGKSTFLRRIGNDLLKAGLDVDFIYSCVDSKSLDGIYIHGINVSFVNGTMPNFIEPKYPGAVERLLDFGNYWDIDYLRKEKDKIKYYYDEIAREYKKFWMHLKNAKLIHDNWKREYMLGMDFKMATDITNSLIKDFINSRDSQKGTEYHRFSSALTVDGQVNFYENLTSGIKNRVVLKGRPGSGKSTLLKRLGLAGIEAGYDVEFYHCSFDASCIDMIIIPMLSFAALDGEPPHVFDPGKNDRLIDMFVCINTSIVNEEENPIKEIELFYSEEIKHAREVYTRIGSLNEELKKFYIEATDFNEIDALRSRITKFLFELKNETGNK